MQRSTLLTTAFLFLTALAHAAELPTKYKIMINSADLSGFDVEMRISNVRGTTRVAMAAHPEYDDRYWRYIENFSAVDSRGRTLPFSKEEDAVWRIEDARDEIVVRYRLHLPAQTDTFRPAWKPFLTSDGGMVGDLHSLMYVVGRESARSQLTLVMPDGWKAASGLEPTSDPLTFTGSTELMLDSPVFIGSLREHNFNAGNVPHKVVFWSRPSETIPNEQGIVDGIRKLADEAIKAFGPPPYPRYAFLFQNGGQAALEHLTSVNLGVDRDLTSLFLEAAHEYIHVWNLMDVRPRERVGLRYRFAEPATVLWWNEGGTIMFSDLLVRRAGLPVESKRLQRLESGMARYLTSPGYSTLSAEQVSRGDSHPILLGDTFASPHLQGEILSTMLDFKIRDATDGGKNVADVLRLLASRFDSSRGVTNADIEKAIADVCRCEVRDFFREYIYGAKQMDFNRYLGLIGVRAEIGSTPAVGRDGQPLPDMRISPMPLDDGAETNGLRIRITNPTSAWAKAGLHTGDTMVSIDGSPIANWTDLRSWLQQAKIGTSAKVVVRRGTETQEMNVTLTGYNIATVRLTEIENATPKQVRLRNTWMSGQ